MPTTRTYDLRDPTPDLIKVYSKLLGFTVRISYTLNSLRAISAGGTVGTSQVTIYI